MAIEPNADNPRERVRAAPRFAGAIGLRSWTARPGRAAVPTACRREKRTARILAPGAPLSAGRPVRNEKRAGPRARVP